MDEQTALGFPASRRFQLERTLGSGGMGIVFEASDLDLHARVALKTLRNLDPHSLYRLKREFRSLQDLHHPNLVSLGELMEVDGRWFFTMELVLGVDFLRYVRGDGLSPGEPTTTGSSEASAAYAPTAETSFLLSSDHGEVLPRTAPEPGAPTPVLPDYDEGRLRLALLQVCRGLTALHTAGKIHRDIKPSNIQVTPSGRVVLLDFGLVWDEEDAQHHTEDSVVGTAAYMAPEQAVGRQISPAADWYSVGVLLYETLTGRLPFTGSTIAMLMNKQVEEPPSPRSVVPGVPADLDALCVELLRFEPERRPGGDEIMARLAGPAAEGQEPPSSHPSLSLGSHFVGRAAELEQLRAAFESTRQDGARVVYVCGESGIGKSTLIRRFLRSLTAEVDELVVLSGRCHERESVPYKAVDGVVDELSQYLRRAPKAEAAALLPREPASLPVIFPVLARVEPIAEAQRPRRGVRDPLEQRNRAFAALRELLARLSDRQPLVLVIDDLQWSDLDSLQLLQEILRPPDPPALLLVASLRDPTEEVARGLAQLPGTPLRIDLEPLAPEEAHALAAHLLSRADTSRPEVAQAIAAEAGGHPLFIDELVHHAELVASDAKAGPLRLAEAIWHRVSQLEPGPVRLLGLIGLAGVPLPQEVIFQAAEIPPGDARRLLSQLRVAHLVRAAGSRGRDTLEPYHHLVRAAVLDHLDDDERRRGHARLALALESSGLSQDMPELIVQHLEAAGRLAEARAHAEEAARVASRALAFERVAGLLRTALRLSEPSGVERYDLLFRLGVALAHAGRGHEAAQAYLEAAVDADPAGRLECQRRAAEQLLISGHIEEGQRTLRKVLAEVGVSLARSPRRALSSLLFGRAALRLRGFRWKPRHESEIAERDLTFIDIHQSVAHGLAMVDTIHGADFQTRGLRLALKAGETGRMLWALCLEAGFVATQGPRAVRRARSIIARAEPLFESGRHDGLRPLLTVADGVATYYEGRFRPAAETLARAEQQLLESSSGVILVLNSARLFRLLALRRLGEFEELKRALQTYVIDAARRGDRYAETSFRLLFNDAWLADDDPARAWRELRETTWVPPEGRFHIQHWYDLRSRAEIAFYEGDGARTLDRWAALFRGLEGSLLLRVQDARADYLWVRARCELLRAADPALASRSLRRAAKLARRLEGERVGYTDVWAQLVRAGIAARQGDRARARQLFARAEQTAGPLDFGLFAAAARWRRGELAAAGDLEARELVASAEAWLREHGVRAPARMVAAVTPGPDELVERG